MSTLSKKLAELTAFDIKKTQAMWSQRYARGIHQVEGADHEHARLAPYLSLLCDCVNALNLRQMHDEDCFDSTEEFKPHEMCECGASVVKQVLAKLQSLVDKEGG